MTDQPTLYVFQGLPGSGKTTAAVRMLADAAAAGQRMLRSNRDCLRDALAPGCYQRAVTELLVTRHQLAQVRLGLRDGWSVVVDDTNFRPSVVDAFRGIADCYDTGFEIVDLTGVPLQTCIDRDAQRPDRGYPPTRWEGARTGEDVIRRMHADWIDPGHRARLAAADRNGAGR